MSFWSLVNSCFVGNHTTFFIFKNVFQITEFPQYRMILRLQKCKNQSFSQYILMYVRFTQKKFLTSRVIRGIFYGFDHDNVLQQVLKINFHYSTFTCYLGRNNVCPPALFFFFVSLQFHVKMGELFLRCIHFRQSLQIQKWKFSLDTS